MLRFVLKRVLSMVPTLMVISFISFVIIQLPPGDYLTSLLAAMAESGDELDAATIDALRIQYGLDQPFLSQYWNWFTGLFRGDFGYSFGWNRPVSTIIWERLGLTLAVTVASLLFSWLISFPIGFYTAVRQHSIGDYIASALGFIGLATPNFLIALILMYLGMKHFNISVGGLFSSQFQDAPWSWAKLADMLGHLWIPMVVVGTSGSASLIRVMRNNLLDELQKPYVMTARAKGLGELKLLLKYPVRLAINPFVSTVGWILPDLISGATITSVVLSLPTTGPIQLTALQQQDMYLAGSITMMLAFLTVLGTLLSDILLALVDPRIRYNR